MSKNPTQHRHPNITAHRTRGFSLIETLIAITILLIAVLAPIRIVTQTIKAAVSAREQLTGTFLAQEGAEAIILLRDNDMLDGGDTWDWYDDLDQDGHLISACVDPNVGCDYDTATDDLVACTSDNCRIYFDETASGGSYYSHDSNDAATPFTRTVVVEEVSDGELEVTSTVTWYSDVVKNNLSVEVQTQIFDQYQ